ncbi:unnamed protein product [marine sediment metagenome]|uniref:Uncharacterized protein n=1 Tax=marine sediment metagenome TaxID=412755 RepID=X1RJS0_9ZZZZ
MRLHNILAEVKQAISNRPIGTCNRWSVGLLHDRVEVLPYSQRNTLDWILLNFTERSADYGLSPAACNLVLDRIKHYLKENRQCQNHRKP